jgi:predicted amidohydrolase YtcJ
MSMETLVLVNSKIHTFDPKKQNAERLVIKEGKIAAAGTSSDIPIDSFPGARVIDLNGMTVIPGFTDSHIHLMQYGLSLRRINVEAPTKEECIRRVEIRVKESLKGRWVLGHGWNQNSWAEGTPNKEDLDSVSPENPVFLTHKSLHSAWVNSATLIICGISRNTSNPKDGCIGRLPDGEPDGILYESAMQLAEKAIPKPDSAEREAALMAAQTELIRFGITRVHDFDDWDCLDSLSKMETEGKLKLRIIKNIPFPNLDQSIEAGIKSGSGREMLSFGWLKLFADGALGPQTAAMINPYEGSNSTGMLFLDREDIIEIGRKAMSAGISLAVHAIGDKANQEVLNGYAQLKNTGYFLKTALKPRIEHVQLISLEDIDKFSSLGIIASMQPIHAVSDRDMADRFWGKRSEFSYAWNSLLKSGAQLLFGSDAPVESPNPFWGLFATVSRSSSGNEAPRTAWTPEQRISLANALSAYIVQPHLSVKSDHPSVRLQTGYPADLVVLPKDILALSGEEIASILPAATMINGEWVFRSSFEIQ